MDLTPFLKIPNSFVLLQAPPAWGKTRLLLTHIEKLPGFWVFLSPLRALAEEFYKSCRKRYQTYILRSKSGWEDITPKYDQPCLVITTPECLSLEKLSLLRKKNPCYVIIDEFHLFYLWGDRFRPVMWEALLGLACYRYSFIALSATMNDKIKEEWRRDFPLTFDFLLEINLGNQRFKYSPQHIYYFSPWGQERLNRHFLYDLLRRKKQISTILYFCRYRSQVDAWVKFCRRRGIQALGCKGGEAVEFMNQLEQCSSPPKVIFATSTLGHGVNLPVIDKVFISYPIKDKGLWLQMASRGGRRGDPFQVYTLESYYLSFGKALKSFLWAILVDPWVRLYLLFFML